MPFTGKFADAYTKGDLFYGFSLPRAALMRSLGVDPGAKGLDDLSVVNNYMITGEEQDSVTPKLTEALSYYRQNLETKRLKEEKPELNGMKWSDKQPFVDNWKEEKKNELDDAVEHHKLQLLKPHQAFEETLKQYKNGKYSSAIGFKVDPSKDKDSENARQNAAWRKKCKGGLYHCIYELQKTVHFCLGAPEKVNGEFVELNHQQIATKTDPYDRAPDTNIEKLRVITPAELRWIYRNRNEVKVQNNVQFWKPLPLDVSSGQKDQKWAACGAPWADDGMEATRNTWASYKPKSSLVHAKED